MLFWLLLCFISSLAWIFIWLRPDQFYFYKEVFQSEQKQPFSCESLPLISVVIPCRNEEEALPHTLPSILGQDYSNMEVILINDQSTDNTQHIAEQILTQGKYQDTLTILSGQPLEPGWAGKMWALRQGVAKARGTWILLTDADIIYQNPCMIRHLLETAIQGKKDMVSLMAKLRTNTFSEKLLIPAFLYFFKMLYPFSQVPKSDSTIAAAAGGCILVRREALDKIGGIDAIRNALIDDIALATILKSHGYALQLLDGPELCSHRGYDSLSGLWKMVTRSAFTELKYSMFRLIGCSLGLMLLFLIPLVATLSYFLLPEIKNDPQSWENILSPTILASMLGIVTWGIMLRTYYPTISYYALPCWFSITLPLAGLLYLAMTWDSARKYYLGIRARWKERDYST